MKRLLLLALLLTSFIAKAQDQFYDAVELTNILKAAGGTTLPNPKPADNCPANPEANGCKVASILRKYATDKNNDFRVIALHYQNNPFLKDLIVVPGIAGVDGAALAQTALKSIGGLDVTNFADGLARFLVKRMKEELNILFFEEFEKELQKQKDLQVLFPSTFSILSVAKAEIYNYQKFLPALQQAFEYDLDEFLTNAYQWSVSSTSGLQLLEQLKMNPKTHNVVKMLLYVGKELDHGTHPGELLHRITEESAIDYNQILPDMHAYLGTADLFSQSLRAKSGQHYWISKQEANQFQDLLFTRVYLGLIYESASDSLKFTVSARPQTLKQILTSVAGKMNALQGMVSRLARELSKAETAIDQIIRDGQEAKGSDYYVTAKIVFSLVDQLATSGLLTAVDAKVLEEMKFYTERGSFLVANVESRAYNAAIFDAYTIVDHALVNDESRKLGANVLKPFLKYGTFMATMTTAKTSEEVADAIEAVALPAGSARIKRESAWNIALNAYLGGFYGNETITVNGMEDKGTVTGVFAPVGLAFSRNFRIRKANFSATLFGSVIDIGSLASYRISSENDAVETLPEIKLENIISPGAYFVLGLPRIPVSIGYGYQITPQLREVTADALTLKNRADRWAGFISVDIPLANLWTRTRRN